MPKEYGIAETGGVPWRSIGRPLWSEQDLSLEDLSKTLAKVREHFYWVHCQKDVVVPEVCNLMLPDSMCEGKDETEECWRSF